MTGRLTMLERATLILANENEDEELGYTRWLVEQMELWPGMCRELIERFDEYRFAQPGDRAWKHVRYAMALSLMRRTVLNHQKLTVG